MASHPVPFFPRETREPSPEGRMSWRTCETLGSAPRLPHLPPLNTSQRSLGGRRPDRPVDIARAVSLEHGLQMSQGCRPPGKVTSDGAWTPHIGPHALFLGHSPPSARGAQITSCQPSPALPRDAHALGAALLGAAGVTALCCPVGRGGLSRTQSPLGLILVAKDQHTDPRDPRGIWPCRAQRKQPSPREG